ncbi:MAG TPA: tetratricopeptide repeat protein, partial [Rhizomicrobium sp.]|nr:tetratricopeptide repeat protein [Rhizomicrobium sp.]
MRARVLPGAVACGTHDRNVDDLTLCFRSVRHPALREAGEALRANRNEAAERTLLRFLDRHPDNVDGLYLMAEAAARSGRFADSERLLARSIEREPAFDAARFAYAKVLHEQGKSYLSEMQLEALSLNDPRNAQYLGLRALVLAALGKHDAALDCCRKLMERHPNSGEFQIRYGHALRAMGLRDECISVYRRVVESFPARGDAYWGLASLKAFRFTSAEIDAMQALLGRSDLTSENRVYLHFALGRALGDLAQWEKSFENYARGNAIRRIDVAYDPDDSTKHASAIRKNFTPAWIQAHAGGGCALREPIFVLGMQRSGSTLVEQILASHSAIEGMGELPEYPLLASCRADGGIAGPEDGDMLDPENLVNRRISGERYLENVRRRRKFV